MKVLVTGGTGLVGASAVDHLLEMGHTVRLLSRNAAEDAKDWKEGVEPHPGDVADLGSVHGAAEGCDAVLHVAGIVAEHPPEVTFQRVNVDGTRNVAREARRAGVRRFVYVSSLGADGGESDYHRSKLDAEGVVREEDPPCWLIVRPGNVYGPGDEVVSLLLRMVRTLPMVPQVGSGKHPFQPAWVDDVGEALARAVAHDQPAGVAVDVAGPQVTTTSEVLDMLARITGKDPPRIPVPSAVAKIGAQAAETLGIDLPVTDDQITMLVEGNVIRPGRANGLTEVFGVEPTPLDVGLTKLADAQPEQLPEEGVGSLMRQRYWADIVGSQLDAEALMTVVREEFATLPPPSLVEVGVEPGTPVALEEGATLTMAIPLRGTIQVRVEQVTPTSATAVTIEGHLLAGIIRFMTSEPEDEVTRFEVRSYARPSGVLDSIGMAAGGQQLQKVTWQGMVEAVVERSGGTSVEGPQHERHRLGEREAKHLERAVRRLVREHQHREDEKENGTSEREKGSPPPEG